MAQNSSTEIRGLMSAFFKGNNEDDAYVDLNFEENSVFRAARYRKARLVANIKSILLVAVCLLALITLISVIIIANVTSNKLAAVKDELKAEKELTQSNTIDSRLFFFAKAPEMMESFEEVFKEVFSAPNGTAIRTKLGEKCVSSNHHLGFGPSEDDFSERFYWSLEAKSVCSTAYGCLANSSTITVVRGLHVKPNQCILCGAPKGPGCVLLRSSCNHKQTSDWSMPLMSPVAPSLTAVDLYSGRLYFSIYSLVFPLECAGECFLCGKYFFHLFFLSFRAGRS